MLYDSTTAQHLKPWLVRTLGPMSVLCSPPFPNSPSRRCDAEPAALAEYVLALLKHNLPEAEMRKEIASQLEEFLEKGIHISRHISFPHSPFHLKRALHL
jgi:RNA-binding protein 26